MTDHIDEPERVLDSTHEKSFDYYYAQRLEINLRHVLPGDEIGSRRAQKKSEKQAREWERLGVLNKTLSSGSWEEEMEWYRNFDPENPQPLDLQNLEFDPAGQFIIRSFAALVERVRAWACSEE